MNHLMTDRRLYVTADRGTIVEEGDPAGSWLLYPVGRRVGEGDLKRYGLEADEHGRVIYAGSPTLPEPEPEPEAEIERIASEDEADGGSDFAEDSDDSDRNDEVPGWPGRTSPEAYLKRYPTGPKAELAKRVIDAKEAGADGAT